MENLKAESRKQKVEIEYRPLPPIAPLSAVWETGEEGLGGEGHKTGVRISVFRFQFSAFSS